MLTTLVTVLYTLAAAVVGGLLQHLTASRITRAAADERRRETMTAAIRTLLSAYGWHRNKQYMKIAARREGQADTPETRQARYDARNELTGAYDALWLLTQDPDLGAAAQDALDAAMTLGDLEVPVGDVPEADVKEAGRRCREAHTALRLAGARYLSSLRR